MTDTATLREQIRQCTACTELPLGPRPVLQVHSRARILIAGQAPGRKVHATGIPFDDASGQRLREWMGIRPADFYDATRIAILPMAFCYPGTGRSGDLPPPPRCAQLWRAQLLDTLTEVQLTIVLGRHALGYHFDHSPPNLTDTVRDWQSTWPLKIALPHPSPRNNRWLARHPWFAGQVLPALQERVASVLAG